MRLIILDDEGPRVENLYRRYCNTFDLAEYFVKEDRELDQAERKEIYVLQDEQYQEFRLNSLNVD